MLPETTAGTPFTITRAAGSLSVPRTVTVAEAIRAYTVGGADAAGLGGELGMLAPGYLADAVVLSADTYTADPASLAEIAVQTAIFDGVVAFQS